jgi:hypothetical protein
VKRTLLVIVTVVVLTPFGLLAQRGGRGAVTLTGQAGAGEDLTGYWVSLVTEDWRWRMMTPPKGDYPSIPLNAEGRRVADGWDRATSCVCRRAFMSPGTMKTR